MFTVLFLLQILVSVLFIGEIYGDGKANSWIWRQKMRFRGSFLTRHLYLTRHFAKKICSVRQFFNSFCTPKMALLSPIFHMNFVVKEYRRGRILW